MYTKMYKPGNTEILIKTNDVGAMLNAGYTLEPQKSTPKKVEEKVEDASVKKKVYSAKSKDEGSE